MVDVLGSSRTHYAAARLAAASHQAEVGNVPGHPGRLDPKVMHQASLFRRYEEVAHHSGGFQGVFPAGQTDFHGQGTFESFMTNSESSNFSTDSSYPADDDQPANVRSSCPRDGMARSMTASVTAENPPSLRRSLARASSNMDLSVTVASSGFSRASSHGKVASVAGMKRAVNTQRVSAISAVTTLVRTGMQNSPKVMTLHSIKAKLDRESASKRYKHWILTPTADIVFATAVLCHTLLLGFDIETSNRYGDDPAMMTQTQRNIYYGIRGVHIVLSAIFSVEVLLRTRLWYSGFNMRCSDYLYLFFDTVLVLLAWADVYFEFVDQESSVQAAGAFRACRLLRMVRIVRMLGIFPELSLLCSGLASSFSASAWTVVLLIMFAYAGALLLTESLGSDIPDLFGTILDSMLTHVKLTLVEAWPDLVGPMKSYSPLWAFYGAFCIAVTNVAMLNVVTGVVCEKVIELAQKAPPISDEEYAIELAKFFLRLECLFNVADHDQTGMLSRNACVELLRGRRTQEVLQEFGIGMPLDQEELFTVVLSFTEGEHVSFDELFAGVMRQRGTRSDHQSQALQYDLATRTKRIAESVAQLRRALRKQMRTSLQSLKEEIGSKMLDFKENWKLRRREGEDTCNNYPFNDPGQTLDLKREFNNSIDRRQEKIGSKVLDFKENWKLRRREGENACNKYPFNDPGQTLDLKRESNNSIDRRQASDNAVFYKPSTVKVAFTSELQSCNNCADDTHTLDEEWTSILDDACAELEDVLNQTRHKEDRVAWSKVIKANFDSNFIQAADVVCTTLESEDIRTTDLVDTQLAEEALGGAAGTDSQPFQVDTSDKVCEIEQSTASSSSVLSPTSINLECIASSKLPSRPGVVYVHVLAATGLPETANPYVIVRIGEKEEMTPTISCSMGACWHCDNFFSFEVDANQAVVELEVYSAGTTDKIIGNCRLPLSGHSGTEWQIVREPLQGEPNAELVWALCFEELSCCGGLNWQPEEEAQVLRKCPRS